MPYRIAGIDVHKKRLSVVVADVEFNDEEFQFEQRWYGSNPEQLRVLSEWLIEQQVEEVVMESTAQYWKPVWGALERYWRPMCQSREGAGRMSGTLHLAQALSNRGRRGRKTDFRDAERLVKRLVSQELVLSFVPETEQRFWRTLTRTRYQRTREKVRLQNQLEALLEEAHNQVVQSGFRPPGRQCASHAERSRGRRNRSRGSGCHGPSASACHPSTACDSSSSRSVN